MGLYDDVLAVRSGARSWPVGSAVLSASPVDRRLGARDDRFDVESYGDFLATSNDIFAIANLRAKKMGALRPLLFDRDGPERQMVTSGQVYDLFRQPNPFWTMERLNRMDELCMCLWGHSFWAIERKAGEPNEFWWMKPTRVKVVPDKSGYVAGFLYDPTDGGEPIAFTPAEVFWQRYPNPINEFAPLAPMAAARLAAETASEMMKANRVLFENGMQPGGFLAPPAAQTTTGQAYTFTDDQAKDLRDKLSEGLKGRRNFHRWEILKFDAQVKELSVTPKDAEWIAGLNMTLRQACRVYMVPSPLMMDLEHATLANVKEFDRMLWDHGLVPDADFRAAEMRLQVLPLFRGRPTHMEWDYSKVPVLQESQTSVWDRECGQLEVMCITINEWRKAKGLPPVPWGDEPFAPVNKAQVDEDGSPPPAPEPPPEDLDRSLRFLLNQFPTPVGANGHH